MWHFDIIISLLTDNVDFYYFVLYSCYIRDMTDNKMFYIMNVVNTEKYEGFNHRDIYPKYFEYIAAM